MPIKLANRCLFAPKITAVAWSAMSDPLILAQFATLTTLSHLLNSTLHTAHALQAIITMDKPAKAAI